MSILMSVEFRSSARLSKPKPVCGLKNQRPSTVVAASEFRHQSSPSKGCTGRNSKSTGSSWGGRAGNDDLVFPRWDGTLRSPNATSTEWRQLLAEFKLPAISLHALRHTHASQLIAAGMDPITISRRLGHASATITLNVYGHLFGSGDDRAAEIIEAAFGKALTNENIG